MLEEWADKKKDNNDIHLRTLAKVLLEMKLTSWKSLGIAFRTSLTMITLVWDSKGQKVNVEMKTYAIIYDEFVVGCISMRSEFRMNLKKVSKRQITLYCCYTCSRGCAHSNRLISIKVSKCMHDLWKLKRSLIRFLFRLFSLAAIIRACRSVRPMWINLPDQWLKRMICKSNCKLFTWFCRYALLRFR